MTVDKAVELYLAFHLLSLGFKMGSFTASAEHHTKQAALTDAQKLRL